MMKRLTFIIALLAACLYGYADEKVTFTASAPDAVVVGDQFRLSYTVTTQEVRNLQMPTIRDFEVLMGPSRSSQTSMQIINGKSTSTSSVTFTYILSATKEGSFTIPGASIVAEGNQMVSNSVTIKVLPADQDSRGGSGGTQQSSSAGQSSGTSVSNEDLFVTATASKTEVYEQEALLLTYKIYIRTASVDLRGFDNVKLPDFKGFHSQEVELPTNRKWNLEHYRGRNYQTTVYRQFVLFPQQSGQLTIEPARFDASMVKRVQIDDLESFFNGGRDFIELKKPLLTSRLNINVKSLPAGKPEGFSGGVGDFNISSTISGTQLKTNDAVTVKIVISGTGNHKLVATPEVQFPEDFEVYDPKVDNQTRLTSMGLTGNQVIEYLAIPRNAGTYKIPSVRFSYFDIRSKSYKTLTTEAYELQVEKGEGNAAQTIANFTNKEDLKILNEDIRFIKQNKVTLVPRGDFFYGSTAYWLCYLVPLLAFIIFFVVYRKQIAANANVTKMRTKKANKVAVKRLKLAGKLLAESKQEAFYDEVLKALWGYVGDKLSIPVSRLSKDNVEEKLRNHGVDDALIKEFIAALDNCEFARYAPGIDAGQTMDKVYADSLAVISKMESSIKR